MPNPLENDWEESVFCPFQKFCFVQCVPLLLCVPVLHQKTLSLQHKNGQLITRFLFSPDESFLADGDAVISDLASFFTGQ